MKKRRFRVVFLFISLVVLVFLIGVLVLQENQMRAEEQARLDRIEKEKELEAEKELEVYEEEPEIEEEKKRTIDDVENINDPDSFTYDEFEAIYFASEGASVKKLPHEKGELVGTLYMDQCIDVLGQCIETGYYKIKINGGNYYVAEDELSAEYFEIPLPLPKEIVQPTKEKDALFIGNSITYHGPAEFWWGNNYGMGATSKANDYVHLTASAMGYDKYDVMSMRDWELKDRRNKYLTYLDGYVGKYDYDVIVIFLGENAKGHEGHFGGDLESMIEYIRAFNPDAKIVMMDNFWKFDDIIEDKKAAAERAEVTYCSLSDLWDVSKYQLQAGQSIEANGGTYTVDSFVAGHPNNAGMKAISEKLVATLQKL